MVKYGMSFTSKKELPRASNVSPAAFTYPRDLPHDVAQLTALLVSPPQTPTYPIQKQTITL